jgi:hypothetical protein
MVSAFSSFPDDTWNYYHFDGGSFLPGPAANGTAFLAVRQRLRPVVLTDQTSAPVETALPNGTGAIAGICYLQSSGGKLADSSCVTPYARVAVQVSLAGKQLVTVQTDDNGYFVIVLPTGTYSVAYGPSKAEVTVDRGITTLVPLRGGKRMVD